MNTTQAKQHGVAAFKAGRGRAPALNKEFAQAACAAGSTKETIRLMDAYLHGWTIASLANGQTDPTLPSVIELAAIESAQ